MVSEILSQFTSDAGGMCNCLGIGRNQGHRLSKAAKTQGSFQSKVERNALGIRMISGKGIVLYSTVGITVVQKEGREGCIPDLGSHSRKLVQEVFWSALLSSNTTQAVLSLPRVLHPCADCHSDFF